LAVPSVFGGGSKNASFKKPFEKKIKPKIE